MGSNRDNKVALVEAIKEKIQNSKCLVFLDYRGITVDKDTELRNKFRAENVEYRVYKNRLLLRALNDLGITGCDEMLQGTTSVAFSYDDETSAARIAKNFLPNVDTMSIKFGVLNGEVVDANKVKALAALPTKPVLLTQLLYVLNAPIRGVAVALKAIAEKE